MSKSFGYVAISCYVVIFDGTNYPDFAAFMRIHMCGLHVWGFLSGKVSCPLYLIAPTMVPTPPTPLVLAAMLLRLKRMQTRVMMMSLLPHMTKRSRSIVPLLGPTG
jgi:hypothetical protein